MQRRSFVSGLGSLLTFAAFTKSVMAEVGVKSPTDLVAEKKDEGIWVNHTSLSDEGYQLFIIDGYVKTEIGPEKNVHFGSTGRIVEEHFNREGLLHRDDDEPAKIIYYKKHIVLKAWYKNGLLHRDNDRPAKLNYHTDGRLLSSEWYRNDKKHRIGNPAYICADFYNNGLKEWYVEDELHREEGPARESCEGPARESRSLKEWYQHNKLYRADGGPTQIHFNNYGETRIWRNADFGIRKSQNITYPV